MPTEEERLELVSTVEDEFTEPLERLEQALENADDEIRQTGKGIDSVRIDVETTSEDAVGELAALDAAIESIDDDIIIDIDTRRGFTEATSGGGAAMASGGTGDETNMFTSSNMNLWEDKLRPHVNWDEFGERGGEVPRADILLEGGMGEHIDFEGAFRSIADSDSDINIDTIKGLQGGPDDFLPSLRKLRKGGYTNLGGDRSWMRQITHRFNQLNFSMHDFHRIIASIIPLVAIFIGAIPAAIGGLVALGTAAITAAGALAGVGLLGAVGMSLQKDGTLSFDTMKDELSTVADSFIESFAPLAQTLAPTFEYFLDSLQALSGPLASASAGLLAFRDEFRGMSDFLNTALPSLASGMIAFGHATMPILSNIVTWFSEVDILGGLANVLRTTMPFLGKMGNELMELLPLIMQISYGFLAFATGIVWVLGTISSVINAIPLFSETLGFLISAILMATTALTLFTIAQESAFIASMKSVVGGIYGYISALGGYITSTISATYATYGLAHAIGLVVGIATLGLGLVIGLGAAFSALADKIGGATSKLDEFTEAQQGSRMPNGMGGGLTDDGSNVYQDNSTTVIYAGNSDAAARQQYSSSYEHKQHIDSVFGGGA